MGRLNMADAYDTAAIVTIARFTKTSGLRIRVSLAYIRPWLYHGRMQTQRTQQHLDHEPYVFYAQNDLMHLIFCLHGIMDTDTQTVLISCHPYLAIKYAKRLSLQ